ncbi:major facilitator superfamily domain-containing protein 9-like [Onthophagus taurus]|uniref:major facilitator superfamily domain-containing protein 9-like n=1 Tax=Onthophagus taurus TaxID=166361 RepID=UPI000C20FD3E|nr:major facilitator superfamily domain-containing protein 9-like [Onthophagus taurus]
MMKLYLIAFLDIFNIALLVPIAPVHLLAIGGTRFQIGLLASLHAVLQLSIGPLIGSWSDTKGRKPLLIQLGFLVLISNALLFIKSSLIIYVFSRFLFGVFGHIQILIKALITDHVPKEKQNEVFAKIGGLFGLSFVVGPLLGSILISYGFEYIAATLTVTSVINLIACLTLPNEKIKQNKTKKGEKELFEAFTNLKTIKWGSYWDVLTYKFLGETSNAAFFSVFGMLIMDEYGKTQEVMAYVLSFFSFMVIVANLFSNKLKLACYPNDTKGLKRNLHSFIIVTLVYVVLYVFSSFWMLVFLIVPLSVFRTLLDVTWTEMLVMRTTKDDSGKIMGVFESMIHMAGLLTPILSGYVVDTYGYKSTFLISVVVLSFGSLLGYDRLNKKRIKKGKKVKNQ